MSDWVEDWERVDDNTPITRGPQHAHGLLEKGFRLLTDAERTRAVRAIGDVLRDGPPHRRISALWLIERLDLTELLPAVRERAGLLDSLDEPDPHREAPRLARLLERLPRVASANPAEFEEELDALTTRVLVPLRATKTIDAPALDALVALVAAAHRDGHFDDQIRVSLAGKLWFIFSAMLAEADHARDPEPIQKQAHRYEEALLRAFGM